MKTIEEAISNFAKDFINENKTIVGNDAPLVNEVVEYTANRFMEQPLSDRITAEEREKIKAKYQGEVEFAQFYQMKANSCVNQQCRRDYEVSRDIAKSRALILESIFGKAMFEEEGGKNENLNR